MDAYNLPFIADKPNMIPISSRSILVAVKKFWYAYIVKIITFFLVDILRESY